MATEKRLIWGDIAESQLKKLADHYHGSFSGDAFERAMQLIAELPSVKAYTPHEVAEIIAELFGDSCACNFNGIDEWLPEKCELLDACPNVYGVACWEQYLKFRDGERKDNDCT